MSKFADALAQMPHPPFTLQRVCELLFDETTYVTGSNYKFAMEKVLMDLGW